MKKTLYIIAAILLLMVTGCEKMGKLEEKIISEWHSTSLSVDGDVYLSFADDRTYELYQKIGDGAYRLYRGTWNIEDGVLTGKYNDGEDWAASYDASIEKDILTLTSRNDAAEISVYASCEIPLEVKTGCEVVVKSDGAGF